MLLKKKTKKKRRRGYKRGLYISPLGGECKFRSSWEEKYMIYLDSNPLVKSWSYEKIVIEYESNKKTKKIRRYYPDFYVEYIDGSKKVIEIKQQRKLENVIVKKKAAAAVSWCAINGAIYIILTELELKNMGLI